jgi:diguanylate cyclase (GGDEF)-like protein
VEARAWSIDDISLIGSLADHLSVAIENAELHQERERQAVIDGLTGVANRRSFNEMLAREYERARRYEHPLSLVMIDLDHLKKINDTYGHQAGDEAIRAIGTVLRQSSRSVDLPARYGGEEFCVLLPNTEIDMAEQLAERLRRLINEVEIPQVGLISASIGVATFPQHADEPDILLKRADEALYVAKQAGRNQVKTSTAVNVLNGSSSQSAATSNAAAATVTANSTSSGTATGNSAPAS